MTFRERLRGYALATIIGAAGGCYFAYGINAGFRGVVAALAVGWLIIAIYEIAMLVRSGR